MTLSRALTGLAAASALLLTGCGVAGTSFHPGVAADVGDISITTDHVDKVATDYCLAIEEQLATDNSVLPQRYLRGGVAGQLALKAVADQLAEKYDVSPGAAYDSQIAQLEDAVSTLPKGQQEAVLEVDGSTTFISEIQAAIGTKLLIKQGTAAPTAEQATAEGQRVFTEWIADNDIQVDPQYGVDFVDGLPVPADTNLSVAAGDTAKLGGAANPDPDYSAALPAAQRCG